MSLMRRLVSSSVTYMRRSTGSHLHRIEGYSLLQQASRPGDAVISKPFHVGGRKFQLLLYPNGITADHRGSVSADLKLAYDDYDDDLNLPEQWHKATATYRVSVLDDTTGSPVRSRTVGPCRFVTPGYDRRPWMFGWSDDEDEEIMWKSSVDELVAADELRRSAAARVMILGDHDCLNVRCDVSVLDTESKWWRNSWCMRLQRVLYDVGLY